jgi:hypothetical protein
MWIRKSNSEIAAEDRRRRFRPVAALCIAALTTALMFLVDIGGDEIRPRPPMSPSFAVERIPFYFVAMFAIVYVSQVLFGPWSRRLDGEPFLCTGCQLIEIKRTPTVCSCGGQFEPLRYYRWGEKSVSEIATRST